MSLNNRLKGLLFNEVSIFIFLWVIYLLMPIDLDVEDFEFNLDFDAVAVTCFYAVVVSINNFVLIPRYLSKGRNLIYLALVICLLVLSSLIDDTIIEFLFEGDDDLSYSWTGGVLYSSVRFAVLIVVFSSFKLLRDHREQEKKMTELRREKVESELKFLKTQINPHVLFNHLNSIYYYAMDRSDKVPEMVLKLSDIMRYILYEASERFVPLEKELEFIRNYIELERIRHEGRGNVQINISGKTENLIIAPLLLISFIENSFKHSHQTQVEDIFIKIEIAVEGNRLSFIAVNSWSERRETAHEGHSGIGLKNVKKRLELLYPERHFLRISNEGGLFMVDMRMQLHHDED